MQPTKEPAIPAAAPPDLAAALHTVNNQLTVILGCSAVLLERDLGEEAKGILRHIHTAGETIKTVTQKMWASADAPATETTYQGMHSARDLPGCEILLVVEDQETLRCLAGRALRKCGYRVLEASHGGEAIAIAAQCGETIDLLVTDVNMPVVGGRELAEYLRAAHPQLQVLFWSGYSQETLVADGLLQADAAFLQKPAQVIELIRKVRALLDGAE